MFLAIEALLGSKACYPTQWAVLPFDDPYVPAELQNMPMWFKPYRQGVEDRRVGEVVATDHGVDLRCDEGTTLAKDLSGQPGKR
jgi:hypothetical protein